MHAPLQLWKERVTEPSKTSAGRAPPLGSSFTCGLDQFPALVAIILRGVTGHLAQQPGHVIARAARLNQDQVPSRPGRCCAGAARLPATQPWLFSCNLFLRSSRFVKVGSLSRRRCTSLDASLRALLVSRSHSACKYPSASLTRRSQVVTSLLQILQIPLDSATSLKVRSAESALELSASTATGSWGASSFVCLLLKPRPSCKLLVRSRALSRVKEAHASVEDLITVLINCEPKALASKL